MVQGSLESVQQELPKTWHHLEKCVNRNLTTNEVQWWCSASLAFKTWNRWPLCLEMLVGEAFSAQGCLNMPSYRFAIKGCLEKQSSIWSSSWSFMLPNNSQRWSGYGTIKASSRVWSFCSEFTLGQKCKMREKREFSWRLQLARVGKCQKMHFILSVLSPLIQC